MLNYRIFTGKTILIAPLDWGLGHATRCVPLIKQLMQHNVVLLGVTPLTKPVLDQEFPSLQQIDLPAYAVSYSRVLPLWLTLICDSFRIRKAINREHALLAKLVQEHHIDVVISDNRFGLHHATAHTVFVTHQLYLKAPIFSGIAGRINQSYIHQFNEVWVPDLEDPLHNLSGELSHRPVQFRGNITFIGPQSRLAGEGERAVKKRYDCLVLLSGPEPQRTQFEALMLAKFTMPGKQIAFVRGTSSHPLKTRDHIDVFDFPDAPALRQLILSGDTVICRSGYSTLMDLYVLGRKNMVLIPTPGQSEQEYLAKHWQQAFGARVCLQSDLHSLTL